MATTPYILTLPSPEASPCRVLRDGVSAMAINAETSADAIAMAKAYHDGSYNLTWAQATATPVAPASDLTGWAMRLKITDPEGVDIFDATVEAADATVGLVKAQGTLTSDATDFADTNTVTIDGKVYTLQSSLTNVDGHVKIGASVTATLLNLLHAINASGGTPGTDYAASTTAHTTVDAISSNATTLVVRAKTAGSAGNALATTETSAHHAWGAATLAGGIGALSKISALALAMVAALNADAAIAGAAFNDTTHVLTVAETTDSLGDHQVYVTFIPSGADRTEVKTIAGMVASQVDGGAAGDALTVTLKADTYTVPTVLALLGA